ncbi:hypothetical protein H0H93_013325, partial [Arthromyces matolae]
HRSSERPTNRTRLRAGTGFSKLISIQHGVLRLFQAQPARTNAVERDEAVSDV